MNRSTRFLCLTFLVFMLAACGPFTPETATPSPLPTASPSGPLYLDPSQPLEARVEDLLARMTLEEKIGQMTQVEKNSIQPGDITRYFIGSILSGGGGSPANNTPAGWYAMVDGFQKEALATRLGIPLIYGVDAVHGHGNLRNATIFPHQVGLGATRDAGLVEQIGRATAEEMLATGVHWNFAPVVAVVQDIRWGRAYEAYGEDTALVAELSAAYLKGLQSLPLEYAAAPGQRIFVLATPKHYIGDGATIWGSSSTYILDQGNMQLSEDAVRSLLLPPYQITVENGALSVMASFSSWKGTKMHAQRYLLTNVLKEELGFQGFIVSDWQAIDQIDADYYKAVVTAINAGVDMSMVPYDYVKFITTMKQAVDNGDIPIERVDDAVRRILRAKFALGLFERPMPDPSYQQIVRSEEHRALARRAVRESLVLLKNDNAAVPIARDTPTIFVAGRGADNIGMQCGGWTIEWQGREGNITAGTSILTAIRSAVSSQTQVEVNQGGHFQGHAEVGVVVVGERPYAEGVGDATDLSLSANDVKIIQRVRQVVDRLIVIILSGRPLIITAQYPLADAWIAAWLPGTEADGITDVLFGDYPFTGKLPYTWPRTNNQLPLNKNNLDGRQVCDGPLFPYGYGLGKAGGQPIEWLDCPQP